MKLSKAKIVLPSIFTSINIIIGLCAVVLCLKAGDIVSGSDRFFILAGWLIIAGAFIDGLDGKIARLTRTTSEFGIQYDSMADIVAFGIAPAVLFYARFLADLPAVFIAVPIVYLVCGAIRLARFNVATDGKKKKCFYGLPIPSAAGIHVGCLMFVDFLQRRGLVTWSDPQVLSAVIGVVFFISALMVTTIEFDVFYVFIFKPFNPLVRVVIVAAIVAGLYKLPGPTLVFFAIAYVTKALARWIYTAARGEEELAPQEEEFGGELPG